MWCVAMFMPMKMRGFLKSGKQWFHVNFLLETKLSYCNVEDKEDMFEATSLVDEVFALVDEEPPLIDETPPPQSPRTLGC